MHGGADALHFAGARATQASTAAGPVAPFPTIAAVSRRSASPIEFERTIEREAVEIVGHMDAARRIRDAIELEEGAGREIGRGDVRAPAFQSGPPPR